MQMKSISTSQLKRAGKQLAIILGVFLLVTMLGYFLFRNLALQHVINKKVVDINEQLNAGIHIENARFSGINTLQFDQISIAPANKDTLLKITNTSLKINLLKIFIGKISIYQIDMEQLELHFVKDSTGRNIDFLLNRNKQSNTTATIQSSHELGRKAYRMLNMLFDLLPSDLTIKQCNVTLHDNGRQVSLSIPEANLMDGNGHFNIAINEAGTLSSLQADVQIDFSDQTLSALLYRSTDQKASFPWIKHAYNTHFEFDSMRYQLNGFNFGSSALHVRANAMFKGLVMAQNRLFGNDTVRVDSAGMKLLLKAGADFIEIDSSSIASLNRIQAHPFVRIGLSSPRTYAVKINLPQSTANDIFTSVPEGVFNTIKGLEADGDLAFNLDFFVDMALPDSLKFSVQLIPHQFKITRYGNTAYPYINGPFTYTAYERGAPVRSFMVGPENPDYRTLDQIPEILRHAVMTSEDGSFYYHNGFQPEAFRQSLVQNIKERRFARGGSTISMQLIKNIYLTRNKNIARKAEEAFIVWLIENYHLVSKNRMLEVYLNIIEWGPGIYGANEASRFYFKKDVSQLTLAEAIFMAGIIPRPKYFRYAFDENGKLKEYMQHYYELVARKMASQGRITEEQKIALKADVTLTGAAQTYITQPDSLPVDSLLQLDLLAPASFEPMDVLAP